MNISTHLEKDICLAPCQASFEFEDDIAAADSEKAPDWEPLEDFRIVTEDEKPPELNAGGRYDEATGKTWFEDGKEQVWADLNTLQGVGVLPDGTFINTTDDKYVVPLYEIIRDEASGKISAEEAFRRKDDLAWEIAFAKHPINFIERSNTYRDQMQIFLNRNISYYQIPDVTKWVDRTLEIEAEHAKKLMNEWLKGEDDPEKKYALMISWFSTGGRYDLKEWPQFQAHSLFVYNGEIVSRDAFGNILYGYISKACGVPDDARIFGAGAQQVLDGTKPEWADNIYDDPRDSERIMQGMDLYFNHLS